MSLVYPFLWQCQRQLAWGKSSQAFALCTPRFEKYGPVEEGLRGGSPFEPRLKREYQH